MRARHRSRFGHRLHRRLWFAVLASLAAFALAAALLGGLWWHVADEGSASSSRWAVLAAELLPAQAGPARWQATLARVADETGASFALYGADGGLLAAAGPVTPTQLGRVAGQDARASGWRERHGPRGWQMPLGDGRRLVIADPWRGTPQRGLLGFVSALALIALAVGVGAYPVVRRLTRRLEALQASLEAFGEGDLATRVPVQGRDEVAALAASFNRSAERIENLLRANRSLLANASHELRSPLARIRMAIELIGPAAPHAAADELRRNIGELDALIDELLLASRIDAGAANHPPEPIDWLALLAEECARISPAPEYRIDPGAPAVRGDPTLLRRLLRNLLENARRYGQGKPIEALIDGVEDARGGRSLRLRVLDRGPGVPVPERERIFEPFYRARGASERAGGVGLGLSLVRQIARRHGGEVRCLARAGGGSCFEFVLPA